MSRVRCELGRDAWLDILHGWMPAHEATALHAELRALTAWEQLPIWARGKEVLQPRLMAWAGELPYRYSGLTLEPRPLTPTLEALQHRIAEVAGVEFNHVVLNLYRDGRDHVGMHADDERELGREPVIASLSLGARRRFVLRPKNRRIKKRREFKLLHGSLFLMGGSCQHTWYHGVPAQPSRRESRINLTFRMVLRPPDPRPVPGGLA